MLPGGFYATHAKVPANQNEAPLIGILRLLLHNHNVVRSTSSLDQSLFTIRARTQEDMLCNDYGTSHYIFHWLLFRNKMYQRCIKDRSDVTKIISFRALVLVDQLSFRSALLLFRVQHLEQKIHAYSVKAHWRMPDFHGDKHYLPCFLLFLLLPFFMFLHGALADPHCVVFGANIDIEKIQMF